MAKKQIPSFQRARQPEQIEQRKEAILAAALALFQEKGLENVALADIAKRVGTATSNLYRYFESREHIYLRVLQRLGTAWEQKIYPPLEKLKGRGTVAKVADIIIEAYLSLPDYGELSTVVNTVLEKRLSPALVVDFRSVFLERRKRLASALASALPKATAEDLLPLTFHVFVHVPGIWPFCHPTPDSRKLLHDPQFVHLNVDFRKEMSRYLQLILTAAHDRRPGRTARARTAASVKPR
jgi:AcrR family transcriptional regulator